jgi:hypothetical protein
MPEAPRPAGSKPKSTTGVNAPPKRPIPFPFPTDTTREPQPKPIRPGSQPRPIPANGGAEVTPPQGLGENKYLSQVSKNQIIKVLEEEYEKILISETVSKSDASVLRKKQIKEFINYLQINENITYSDLNEKWPGLGKVLGKVGRFVFGPVGTAIGTAYDLYNFGKNPKQWWKDFNDDYVVPDPVSGPLGPSTPTETIISETPENLPESMKAFWKQRLGNQLNEKKGLGSVLGKLAGKVLGPLGVASDLYDLYDIYKNPQNYPAPKSPQGPPAQSPTSPPPQIAPKY